MNPSSRLLRGSRLSAALGQLALGPTESVLGRIPLNALSAVSAEAHKATGSVDGLLPAVRQDK